MKVPQLVTSTECVILAGIIVYCQASFKLHIQRERGMIMYVQYPLSRLRERVRVRVLMMLILLAENDESFGETLYNELSLQHNQIEWLKDDRSIRIALSETQFDGLIIDDAVGKINALELISHLRANSNNLPVIALSAQYAIETRIRILDCGADDLLLKPFDIRELSARLRALQRRSIGYAAPLLSCADVVLNPATYTVFKDDQQIPMPPKEFLLLKKLLEGAGRVLSREQLCQSLYGWNQEMDSNALEVHIHNLRKKIGEPMIRTVRGVGYMIEKR